ncbi:MAG: M23 family metallopeptidase [Proteobacteria bacterium]|nr:M23 family metallopeptidase [Pseudomonadota bacterium]
MAKLEANTLTEFGENAVPKEIFYNSDLSKSASKIVAERRAYVKFKSTGKGVCGAVEATIESAGVSNSPYTDILSGPRLVPPPSISSVDWNTSGANDISDAYLWKATVNFVCYSPEQFESFDRAFFRHFSEVEITFGWLNNPDVGSITISGTIIDYQFTINEKLQYDCSVTVSGKHVASSAGLSYGGESWDSNYIRNLKDKKQIKNVSFGGALKLQAEGMFGGKHAADGKAKASSPTGQFIEMVVKDNSGFQSWVPDIINYPEKYIYFVSITHLINVLNKKYKKDNFDGFKYYLSEEAREKLTHVGAKSANPYSVLNQFGEWTANYNDNFNMTTKPAQDLYISCDDLIRIDGEIRGDKGDNPHKTKETLIQLLQRIFAVINEAMGYFVEISVIPYGQSGQLGSPSKEKWGFEITDRKTVIKKKVTPTVVNILSTDSLVRSINIQSNIDSEMAAIAQAGSYSGEGGKNNSVKSAVFGCPPPPNKQSDLQKIKDEIWLLYNALNGDLEDDAKIIPDLITATKKMFAIDPGKVSGYSYGVTCTITVDGNPQYLFGKTFTVSGLPSMLNNENVYFSVLSQSHKFDNGDWTMDLEGQMMLDPPNNNSNNNSSANIPQQNSGANQAVINSNKKSAQTKTAGYSVAAVRGNLKKLVENAIKILGNPKQGTHGKSAMWQNSNAWDIQGAKGSAVYALVDGVVTKIQTDPHINKSTYETKMKDIGTAKIYGEGITIKGSPNIFYAHMCIAPGIGKGSIIKKGQIIGYLAHAPACCAPHLHIGIDGGFHLNEFIA